MHDHAVDAVAALHGLFLDEGFLQRVWTCLRAQPFERDDLAAVDRGEGRYARAHRIAVDVDGAGPALAEAAAESRSMQAELVPQNIEQRRIGIIDRDRHVLAVHVQGRCSHRDVLAAWLETVALMPQRFAPAAP